jgi:hypothetical protein
MSQGENGELLFMVDFFKELEKAKKHLDNISKEWEPKKKHSKDTSKKTQKKKVVRSEGFDLRKYLTIDEAARLSKLPLDSYSPYLDDEWEGGVYTSSDPKVHTYFQVWFARKNVEEYNPDGIWSYFEEVTPNLQQIKDLGDKAFWSSSNSVLFVRKEQDVLQAVTTSNKGLSLDIMKQLVELILSKL